MKSNLRTHLSQDQYRLPEVVIDEVCSMFASEAANLLDSLSGLESNVRNVALGSLRDYYRAIEQKNNPTFIHVAQIMSFPANKSAANDGIDLESDKVA